MARFKQELSSSTIPALPFNQCWAKTDASGKPGLSVLDHCRVVGHVAKALLDFLPTSTVQRLGDNPVLAAALHDVGKVSPGFQLKYFRNVLARQGHSLGNHSSENYESDHAQIGACALWQFMGNSYDIPVIVKTVAMHHGSIRKVTLPTDEGEIFGGEPWSVERKRLIEHLVHVFGPVSTTPMDAGQCRLLSGLVTIADWIGSDENLFSPQSISSARSLTELAIRSVERCGFRKPYINKNLEFAHIFGNSPYPLQQKFSKSATAAGLYILEAPMGAGKTEAALFAAYELMKRNENCGFFFGLPTRLTSDRIHERVEKFLARICPEFPDVKLAHGNAWLNTFQAGGEELRPGNSWFNPRKRALLHPFVVGTIDQALMSVLRVKHHFIRSFALAGKVVILDEVHTYDTYTGTLLDELVHELRKLGCTVIILTATLTRERRSAFFTNPQDDHNNTAYPLITQEIKGRISSLAEKWDMIKKHKVKCCNWTNQEVATQANAKARQGECVLAIANSVAQAQAWYAAIAAERREKEFPIGLLHSKFPTFQRRKIEDLWMKRLGNSGLKTGERPKGCVLVATQVVEQSVDIDADFLITELAPTDMLLQRMGRQWRHEHNNRPTAEPKTIIVTAAHEAQPETVEQIVESLGRTNSLVYSPYVLWRTLGVWKKRSKVTIPLEIRELLEQTYCTQENEPPAVCELRKLFEKQRDKLRRFAIASRAEVTGMPTGDDKEGVATRYSDLPTMQAVLARSVESSGIKAKIELLDGRMVEANAWTADLRITATLYENLVSIASYVLEKIDDCKTPKYLSKHFFDKTPILIFGEDGKLYLNDKPTGLTYSEEMGVVRKTEHGRQKHSLCTDFGSEYDEFDVCDKSRFDW